MFDVRRLILLLFRPDEVSYERCLWQKNGQSDPKKKLRHFGVGSATVPANTGGHGGPPYCANLA
jgi:hypothetical protein